MPMHVSTLPWQTARPRFGWFNQAHKAIDKGGLSMLPQSSYKDYLTRHFSQISEQDDLRDLIEQGPNHFFDMEPLSNQVKLKDKRLVWRFAERFFSPKRKKALKQSWEDSPPQPHEVHDGPSLITKVEALYAVLVKELRVVKGGLIGVDKQTEMGAGAKKELLREMSRTVGKLSHFVGDSFMPLHLSVLFNWGLEGKSEKGMHMFVDGLVLSDKEHQAVGTMADTKPKVSERPRLSSKSLRKAMLQAMMRSYMENFTIRDAQQRALAMAAEGDLSADAYEDLLRDELKPVVSQQLQASQKMLSRILQAAWVEAGKPEIPDLSKSD